MNTNEKDLGYLLRAVEELTEALKEHMKNEEKDREAILGRIKSMEDNILIKKGMWKVIALIGAMLWAVVTMKTGSAKELWTMLSGMFAS